MESLAALCLRFNWTAAALVIILVCMFVVEGARVLGRASDARVRREVFDVGHYVAQFVNWFPWVLNFASCLVLLAVRDYFVKLQGLKIEDPDTFEIWYAFGLGVAGQLIFALATKAFMGALGAFGKPAKE